MNILKLIGILMYFGIEILLMLMVSGMMLKVLIDGIKCIKRKIEKHKFDIDSVSFLDLLNYNNQKVNVTGYVQSVHFNGISIIFEIDDGSVISTILFKRHQIDFTNAQKLSGEYCKFIGEIQQGFFDVSDIIIF